MKLWLYLALALWTLGIVACGDEAPSDSGVRADSSVGDSGMDAGDTGPDTDTGPDAGPDADTGIDAGPCGMECTGTTPMCNPTTGTCVACVLDEHCTDPTLAKCGADGMCTACDDSAQCGGITGTEVCATTGDNAGECVECAAGEVGACGGNVCDSRMNTCTTTLPGMTGLCRTCVADAQCRAGQLCVPMTFGMPAVEVGLFCLWRRDATESGAPAGSCTIVSPYKGAPEVTSVDGVTTTVCSLRVSTCEAHRDFDITDCSMPGTTAPDECGVSGLDDGWCAMVDAVTNRCTVPCGSHDDCQSGFLCNDMVTPRVCSF